MQVAQRGLHAIQSKALELLSISSQNFGGHKQEDGIRAPAAIYFPSQESQDEFELQVAQRSGQGRQFRSEELLSVLS